MNKPSGTVNETNAFVANDDMEQVRQLLIGEHAAQQNETVSALEKRIMVLEQLVHALIAHGNANNHAWQTDVAALAQRPGCEDPYPDD